MNTTLFGKHISFDIASPRLPARNNHITSMCFKSLWWSLIYILYCQKNSKEFVCGVLSSGSVVTLCFFIQNWHWRGQRIRRVLGKDERWQCCIFMLKWIPISFFTSASLLELLCCEHEEKLYKCLYYILSKCQFLWCHLDIN